MNNHRKGINNRFNLQICYDLKFRTLTIHCILFNRWTNFHCEKKLKEVLA